MRFYDCFRLLIDRLAHIERQVGGIIALKPVFCFASTPLTIASSRFMKERTVGVNGESCRRSSSIENASPNEG